MPRAATQAVRVAGGGRRSPRTMATGSVRTRSRAVEERRRTGAAKPSAAARPRPRPLARSAHGVLDRMLRGKVWVGCIGLLLVGIVFLNVSLLGLNSGIAVTADQIADLRHQNADLRLEVARLGSSERIQEVAEARGFVMPAPDGVTYIDARPDADGRRAAVALRDAMSVNAPVEGAATEPLAPPSEEVATEPPAPTAGTGAPEVPSPVEPAMPPVTGATPEPPAG